MTVASLYGPYFVLTKSVARVYNPFRDDVWGTGTIKRQAIQQAVRSGNLDSRPNDTFHLPIEARRPYDINRIAYLVIHSAEDPISLDVGLNGMVVIEDGFHRLGAAMYRRDRFLLVSYAGYVDGFHRRFRVALNCV